MIGCGQAQIFAWFVDLEKAKAEFKLVCLALKTRTIDLSEMWCAVLYQLRQWMSRKEHHVGRITFSRRYSSSR